MIYHFAVAMVGGGLLMGLWVVTSLVAVGGTGRRNCEETETMGCSACGPGGPCQAKTR